MKLVIKCFFLGFIILQLFSSCWLFPDPEPELENTNYLLITDCGIYSLQNDEFITLPDDTNSSGFLMSRKIQDVSDDRRFVLYISYYRYIPIPYDIQTPDSIVTVLNIYDIDNDSCILKIDTIITRYARFSYDMSRIYGAVNDDWYYPMISTFYSMNIDGSDLQQSSSTYHLQYPFIEYIPSSQNFYFVSGPPEEYPTTQFDLYRMDQDGSNLINITNNTDRELYHAISPDENLLLIHTASRRLYILDLNSSEEKDILLPEENCTCIYQPEFSPNDSLICFTYYQDSLYYNSLYDLVEDTLVFSVPFQWSSRGAFSPDNRYYFYYRPQDLEHEYDGLYRYDLMANKHEYIRRGLFTIFKVVLNE